MSVVFIFVPLNFFDSEIHYRSGLQDFTVTKKLPLGHYLGIGIDQDKLEAAGVESFKLTRAGSMLVAMMLVGIPGLIAYRFYLKNTLKKNKHSTDN